MDDETFFAQMEQTNQASEKLVTSRQNDREPAEGYIAVKGVFRCYRQYNSATGKFEEFDFVPQQRKITSKEKTFLANIECTVKVTDILIIPGVCEALPDGNGWRVRAKITYNKKSNAEQWLHDVYQPFFSKQFAGQFQVDKFIDESGHLLSHTWVEIFRDADYTFKVTDNNESIFRKEGSGVTAYAPLKFAKVALEHQLSVKDGNGTAYTSFASKGAVGFMEDYNPNLSISEQIHLSQKKDGHRMVPIEEIRNNGKHVPNDVYFYVKDRYRSDPNIVEDGIIIFKTDPLPNDFLSTFDNKPVPQVTFRFNVSQWNAKTRMDGVFDMYHVMISSTKNRPDIWKAFGILDPNVYARIMEANHRIYCHVDASLNRNGTINAPSNAADKLNDREEVKHSRGYYNYFLSSVTPDYLRYFSAEGHHISRKRVEEEFANWIGTTRGETTLNLKPLISNPLNSGTSPAVIALGNGTVSNPGQKQLKPLYHAYDGDAAEFLDTCDFYVLTNHQYTREEREQCTGYKMDPEEGDAMLSDFKTAKTDLLYWIFAVKRVAVPASYMKPTTTTTTTTKVAKNAKNAKRERE